jgi:flagellar basal body rod protein FlgB
MNLTALATDNVTEVLATIIKFTQTRQRVLIQNIINMHRPGFVPKELEVNEFSSLVNYAIDEHVRNRRLVLRDTENIKFGISGSFEVKPVMDEPGKELLEDDPEGYLKRQIGKLWENSLNQKVAAELLRQKQGAIPLDY